MIDKNTITSIIPMPNHLAYLLPFDELDIVLVDDSRPMRQIFNSIMLSFGVSRFRMFANAETALEEMENDPPNMLITDWRMKPMDGYQLLSTIRHSGMMPLSLLPVIMITGFASRQFVQKCFDSGVQQFLVKPVSPKTIHQRIKWTLRDSRLLVPKDGVFRLQQPARPLSSDSAELTDLDSLHEDETYHGHDADVVDASEEQRIVNDSWQI